MLATLVNGGGVIAIDIQEDAIAQTQQLLEKNLSSEKKAQVHLLQHSHEEFPEIAKQHLIKLIVYNLGYLPGGNKQLTTTTDTTVTSVQKALTLLCQEAPFRSPATQDMRKGPGKKKPSKPSWQSSPCQWNVCTHTFTNGMQPRVSFH